MIQEAAIKTKDVAGSSGQDADQWKRILASKNYGKYSSDLREQWHEYWKSYADKKMLQDDNLKHYLLVILNL